MKISELLTEAKDYDKIKDSANRWLAMFTYENYPKNPSEETINTLLKRYPAKAGIIYRGMNFYTKESYDEFMKNNFPNGATESVITTNVVTSWTPSENASEQFAVTQPTYNLNASVMRAYDEQQKNKERLAGYRGIILSTIIDDNQGIDVDASGLGHETEVVLPVGKYNIKIHREIKKYEHHLADNDTNIDKVIQSTTKESMSRSGPTDGRTENSFYDYVIHHHIDKINDKSRLHLFKLFLPNPLDLFRYEAKPYVDYFEKDGPKSNKVTFDYYIPGIYLFDFYNKGVFRTPKQKKLVVDLAKKTMTQALPIVKQYVATATVFKGAPLILTAKIAGMESQLAKVLRDTLGTEYRRLQDEGRKINQIKDYREQQEALKKHSWDISNIVSKMT